MLKLDHGMVSVPACWGGSPADFADARRKRCLSAGISVISGKLRYRALQLA